MQLFVWNIFFSKALHVKMSLAGNLYCKIILKKMVLELKLKEIN